MYISYIFITGNPTAYRIFATDAMSDTFLIENYLITECVDFKFVFNSVFARESYALVGL